MGGRVHSGLHHGGSGKRTGETTKHFSQKQLIFTSCEVFLSSQGGVDHKSHFEWHIIPVLNPDGYVYTWTKDRMWRKNRFSLAENFNPGVRKVFFSGSPRLLRVMWERTSTEISPSVGSTGRITRRATHSGVRGHSPLWR